MLLLLALFLIALFFGLGFLAHFLWWFIIIGVAVLIWQAVTGRR